MFGSHLQKMKKYLLIIFNWTEPIENNFPMFVLDMSRTLLFYEFINTSEYKLHNYMEIHNWSSSKIISLFYLFI